MKAQTNQVLKNAIDLPPVERAELVEKILSSFDCPSRQEIDALWMKEAEERIDAYDRGEITATSASEVFEKIDREKL